MQAKPEPRVLTAVQGVVALVAGILGLLITLGGPMLTGYASMKEQGWKLTRLEQSQQKTDEKVTAQQDRLIEVRERIIRIEGKQDEILRALKR